MRRKDQQIVELKDIEAILFKATVCRLSLLDGEYPYIVPLCFGYKNGELYFHSALEGKKIDLIRRHDKVCFEVEAEVRLMPSENACKWGVSYESVVGCGRASLLHGTESKRKALDVILRNYTKGAFQCPDKVLKKTAVIKVDIHSMTGKRSKPPPLVTGKGAKKSA